MPRAKILIVDASPGITIAARNVLVAEGYETFVANGVAEAIRIAGQAYPDLVVLDADLAAPLTLRAFARATRPQLDVILAVTRLIHDPTAIEVLEDVRIVATIQKPFAPAALIAAIQRAVPEGDEDPTVESFEPVDAFAILGSIAAPEVAVDARAVQSFDTIEDDAAVTPRALWLAERIGHELPGLTADPIQRRLLTRACALALEEESFGDLVGPPAAAAATDGVVALEGRVGPVPVEQIFHLAENMPGTVGLRIERSDPHLERIELFFVRRHVVFGRGQNLPPGFTFGRFLVEAGAIDADTLERFVREESSPFRRLGEQLLRSGYIDEPTLVVALERQVQLLVTEAIRWTDSSFTLLREVELPEAARTSGVELPVPLALLEGMRRLDEWHRFVDDMGGLSAIPVRIDKRDPVDVDHLTPAERSLLVYVNGLRNVEDLARSARRPTFDVCQALAQLRYRRMVTVA